VHQPERGDRDDEQRHDRLEESADQVGGHRDPPPGVAVTSVR
jgi:hypothetical protein